MINSLEATKAQHKPWVKIEFYDRGELVEISIIDNGTGIPNAIQSKILEPFYTTKEVGDGAGLGLSTAKGLVESHGGSLKLTATNPFTRFTITIPKSRHLSAS